MRNNILLTTTEPTDAELTSLIKGVASDAKQKALLSSEKLTKKIKGLILKALEK